MILIDLTPEEIEALRYEHYHHPRPKVQRKEKWKPFGSRARGYPINKSPV